MARHQGFLYRVQPMRKELFWDRFEEKHSRQRLRLKGPSTSVVLITLREVQEKYGMEKFVDVLMTRRNLRKVAVNYWCWCSA